MVSPPFPPADPLTSTDILNDDANGEIIQIPYPETVKGPSVFKSHTLLPPTAGLILNALEGIVVGVGVGVYVGAPVGVTVGVGVGVGVAVGVAVGVGVGVGVEVGVGVGVGATLYGSHPSFNELPVIFTYFNPSDISINEPIVPKTWPFGFPFSGIVLTII
jgi:hypothetical protein